LQDYHLHPNFSIDAEGSVDEFCQVALAKGLSEICFTTHLDSDPEGEDMYIIVRGKKTHIHSHGWLENYEAAVRTADDEYRDKGLRVRLGIEVDCYPCVLENLPEEFHKTDFDLVLGSVHLIDHKPISVKDQAEEIFKKHGIEEVVRMYYNIMIDVVGSGIIDVLAHLDLYRRYGEVLYSEKIHDLWKPHIDVLTSKMKSNDIGFEINTSSWRKGLTEPMPERAIIEALADRGIERVIVGSDAHTPSDVGAGIKEAIALLNERGYSGPVCYERRKVV
jgi:histidinol-phosphatase (PHP family)